MIYDHFDLDKAVKKLLFSQYGNAYAIAAENVKFDPPADGSTWLKMDYMPADRIYQSLDRKCVSIIGMVQIGVVFSPDKGVESARLAAKNIANFFEDGKILDVGYIFEGGESHPTQKHERGWMIPVRFYVRYDGK